MGSVLGTDPEITKSFAELDMRVDRAIGKLCSIHLPAAEGPDHTPYKTIGPLRSLPTHLGGLGVYRHSWVHGQKQALQTHSRTCRFIDRHHPELTRDLELALGDSDAFSFFPPFNADDEFATRAESQSSTEAPQEPTLEDKVSLIYELTSDYLIQHIATTNRLKAAWLRSNRFEGSGRWLMSAYDAKQDTRSRFSTEEYTVALRWRLLESPFTDLAENVVHRCPVCANALDRHDPYHVLNCSRSGFVSKRHAVILRVINDFLKKQVQNVQIQSSSRYHDMTGQPVDQRTDLLVTVPQKGQRYLDLCVCNPAANTFVSLRQPSHLHDLATATYWEDYKRRKVAHTKEVADGIFVPFAIEATGRMGHAAVEYIHQVTDYSPDLDLPVYIPPPSRILQGMLATAVTKSLAAIAIQYHRMLREANQPPDQME